MNNPFIFCSSIGCAEVLILVTSLLARRRGEVDLGEDKHFLERHALELRLLYALRLCVCVGGGCCMGVGGVVRGAAILQLVNFNCQATWSP